MDTEISIFRRADREFKNKEIRDLMYSVLDIYSSEEPDIAKSGRFSSIRTTVFTRKPLKIFCLNWKPRDTGTISGRRSERI